MGLLYGRAGRLNTKKAGFWPGQVVDKYIFICYLVMSAALLAMGHPRELLMRPYWAQYARCIVYYSESLWKTFIGPR
jgi:hypothetical protein